MMRFFGLSDVECLRMPSPRFFALYRAIRAVELEEEARSLIITHHGEPGKRLEEIRKQLESPGKRIAHGKSSIAYVHEGLANYEQEPGRIAEIRRKQRESAERIEQERLLARSGHKTDLSS
jgi:hypothetical protein